MGALLTLTVLSLGGLVGPVPVAIADGGTVPRGADRVTVSPYDLETELPADVAARSGGNNVAVNVVLRRPLVDGTVVVEVPRRTSRTDLHPAGLLSRDDPGLPGSVVVRPVQPGETPPTPPAERRSAAGAGAPAACAANDSWTSVSTSNTARQHVAVVRHMTCAAGQRISVRLAGLEAPHRRGTYVVTVAVSDADGLRTRQQVRLHVVKKVTTRLVVSTLDTGSVGVPMSVTVRAVRPDGRPDRRMSGWVRVFTVGGSAMCGAGPDAAPMFELTPADAGVKVLTYAPVEPGVTRLAVESITRRAAPAATDPFPVDGEGPVCPPSVSYH